MSGFSSAQTEQIVGEDSRAAVRALQNNDTRALAKFVHPTQGVRFSPYVHADEGERIIRRAQMPHLAHHPRRWNWGSYDGEGGDMMLTWNEFRRKILVPRPYLPIANTGAREDFNRLSQNGNVPNNLLDVYHIHLFYRSELTLTCPITCSMFTPARFSRAIIWRAIIPNTAA